MWLKHSIDKFGLFVNKTNATKAIINSNTEKVNARLRAKRPLVKKTMSAEIKGNNINKTVKWDLYKKDGINTERLIEFLKELLKNTKDKLIILDNASSHRNDTIKNFIKNSGKKIIY